MVAEWRIQEKMLQSVADALGPELLHRVAFVGGCTTALMVTDDLVREAVRFTEDVDVIVHVLSYGSWQELLAELRSRGFRESSEDEIICRMRLHDSTIGSDVIVDFMPDDETILGFTNRWYRDALKWAGEYALPSGTIIRVVTPAYFLATKLEAYRGRGGDDPLCSRDVEDILAVVDGRESLLTELDTVTNDLRNYIARTTADLLAHRDFAYAVQSAAGQNRGREVIIFQRLKEIATPSFTQ